jgi:hypothetical protein
MGGYTGPLWVTALACIGKGSLVARSFISTSLEIKEVRGLWGVVPIPAL